MTTTDAPPAGATTIDKDALRRKYAEERAKRLRPDGNDQYIQLKGHLAHYLEDPYTPVRDRARKADQVRAGTGLGLAISRGFVEAMQGIITAANRTDRTGAVFTITLPIPAKIEQLDTAA